jgi:uncharacterized protein (DUF2461 family)
MSSALLSKDNSDPAKARKRDSLFIVRDILMVKDKVRYNTNALNI